MDTPREPASQLEPPDASTQLAARGALGAAVAVPLQASSMQQYHRRRTQSAIIFFCCPRAPACRVHILTRVHMFAAAQIGPHLAASPPPSPPSPPSPPPLSSPPPP